MWLGVGRCVCCVCVCVCQRCVCETRPGIEPGLGDHPGSAELVAARTRRDLLRRRRRLPLDRTSSVIGVVVFQCDVATTFASPGGDTHLCARHRGCHPRWWSAKMQVSIHHRPGGREPVCAHAATLGLNRRAINESEARARAKGVGRRHSARGAGVSESEDSPFFRSIDMSACGASRRERC